jgi:hypothetical protein
VYGGSDSSYGVYGYSINGRGVYGIGPVTGVHGSSFRGYGVYGGTEEGLDVYASSSEGFGVVGTSPNRGVWGSSYDGHGVHGSSKRTFGVVGTSPNRGVWGSSYDGHGVHGDSHNSYDVYAFSNSSDNYALYVGSSFGLAAWLDGEVTVSGRLIKAGGGFRIDHPVDLANKYLSHSFVESPDMKNVYDGVVALDDKGEAVIDLPDRFRALNKDFRYHYCYWSSWAQSLCCGGNI